MVRVRGRVRDCSQRWVRTAHSDPMPMDVSSTSIKTLT